jgi:hypothetical protein
MKNKYNWMVIVLTAILLVALLSTLDYLSGPMKMTSRSTQITLISAAEDVEYIKSRQPFTDDLIIQTDSLNSWLDLASENPSLYIFESWRKTAFERMDLISADFEAIRGLTPPAAWADDHQKLINAADEFEIAKEILITGIQQNDLEAIKFGETHLQAALENLRE